MTGYRIGIIGFGFIGGELYRRLLDGAVPGAQVAFVHDWQADRVAGVRAEHVLDSLEQLGGVGAVDLVVECAGPEVTVGYGRLLLARCDYMPLSVTALADDELLRDLRATARAAETRLLIAHGALAGLDALHERRESWQEVKVTFRKPPQHIEGQPGGLTEPRVLYDGPVRGIAARYPRNVNAMVSCALATIGLDRCRGALVADPGLDELVAEVRAVGADGAVLEIVKRQPGLGVSGTEMPDSILRSIQLALASRTELLFV